MFAGQHFRDGFNATLKKPGDAGRTSVYELIEKPNGLVLLPRGEPGVRQCGRLPEG
jgi:hypothetical protein